MTLEVQIKSITFFLTFKLADRVPQCSAYGTTEMRSRYTPPVTPPRLITDKDQYKLPTKLPLDPVSIAIILEIFMISMVIQSPVEEPTGKKVIMYSKVVYTTARCDKK